MNRRSFLELGAAAALISGLAPEGQASRLNPVSSYVAGGEKDRTVLINATMIDGVRSEPQSKCTVVIESGRILRAGMQPPTRAEIREARVIDLEHRWVLPGLCDAHSHLINPLHGGPREKPIERYIRMGAAAMDALNGGITSLRVLGAPGFSDVAWRNAFARGLLTGPRLVVAGHTIVPTGGHGASYNYGQIAVADGPMGVRRAVREQIQNDVDQIKLTITGGVFGHRWDNLNHTQFLSDEIEAAAAVARDRGYKLAVHAGNPTAVKRAIRAGAHTIEHGYVLDEESIQLMRKQNVILVPTLCVTFLTQEAAESPFEKAFTERWPLPMNLRQRANERRPTHLQSFQAALAAGVSIASGADHSPPGETVFLEIEMLVRCGMTPMQAIISATRVSAEALDRATEIGTLQAGKMADLLVVDGDPLTSIFNLRRTVLVFKQGRIVVDRRASCS